MPRRKSLTRRFLQHLLLISLARAILTVFARGRSYDDWDEGKLVEPAQERSHKSRFAHTLSFGALFFAGLALSAGAGNGVRTLLDEDGATPAAQGARADHADRPHRSGRADGRRAGRSCAAGRDGFG
jgi:photosystem II stability/assembly factor-like uncharacterized protein